ncbi:MAG TPA: DUF6702 family protein [Pedobacter sp.]|nr:DUF6702 family protein [Pedobacter sp.]
MLQLSLLVFLNLFHPFYVSVTEIEQNPTTKTIQVSARIFYDDLEKAIYNRYKIRVNILKPADRKQADLLVAAYVKEHLRISANNKALTLKYVGYEIEEEAAWCYFETEKIDQIRNLSIQNDILFEQHAQQINMIHAIVKGQRKSTKLDNPKNKADFSF